MDVSRAAVTAEPYYIRVRAWLRLLIAVAGLAILLLGMYNMFGPLLLEREPWRVYQQGWLVVFDRGAFFVEDIVVMAVGAALAYWV